MFITEKAEELITDALVADKVLERILEKGEAGTEAHEKACEDTLKAVNDLRDYISELEQYESVIQQINSITLRQTDRIFFLDKSQLELDKNNVPKRTQSLIPLGSQVHPLTCINTHGVPDNNQERLLFPYYNGEKVVLICRNCDYTQ